MWVIMVFLNDVFFVYIFFFRCYNRYVRNYFDVVWIGYGFFYFIWGFSDLLGVVVYVDVEVVLFRK